MNGSQTRRPRPRARDPTSIEKEGGGGAKVDGDDLFVKSGPSSILSQSPKKKVGLKRERPSASQKSADKDAGTTFLDLYRLDDIDAPDDDDEYLFNRTRSRNGPSLLVDPVDLTAPVPSSSPRNDGQDDGGGEHDSDESGGIQSKKLNPWAKRTKKQYRSQWSRVDSRSTSSKKKVKELNLSSDSDTSGGEDTTLTSPVAGDPSVKKADGRAAKVNLLTKRRSRSRSITPPPEVEAKKLLEIEKMIKTVLDRSSIVYERASEHVDEDSVDALLNDDNVMADLDPDLRRAMRGSSAAVLRKQLREKDARTLEMQARARRSLSRQTNSTNNTANGSSVTIEISDSDNEDRRKAPSTSYASRNDAGVPNNAQPSKRRNTRNSARARDSSSPILVSVINGSDRQTSPPRRSQKAPTRPRGESPETATDDGAHSDSDTQGDDKDDIEERSQSMATDTNQWQTQRGANEQAQEEEEERIQIVMKGGPQGTLQVLVNVRRSTLIEKLLDHFIKVHRDAIPLERTSKVRIRFDGEILKDKDTVADIGIEDEEQMDVVW